MWELLNLLYSTYFLASQVGFLDVPDVCSRGSWARDVDKLKNVRVVFLLGRLENNTFQGYTSLTVSVSLDNTWTLKVE